MKVVVASNHVGFKVKNGVLDYLTTLGHEAFDLGPPNDEICDYPDYAAKASAAVSSGQAERAILISGTGIGMSIVANRFRGVRAALCHDDVSAQLSRRYNDANVLCLPANIFCEETAPRLIEIWIQTPFEGNHHARRIAKITRIEDEIRTRQSPLMFTTSQSKPADQPVHV